MKKYFLSTIFVSTLLSMDAPPLKPLTKEQVDQLIGELDASTKPLKRTSKKKIHHSQSQSEVKKKERAPKQELIHLIKKADYTKLEQLMSTSSVHYVDEEVVNASRAKLIKRQASLASNEPIDKLNEYKIVTLMEKNYIPKPVSGHSRSHIEKRKSKAPEKLKLLTWIEHANLEEFRRYAQTEGAHHLDEEAFTAAKTKFENTKHQQDGNSKVKVFFSNEYLIMVMIQAAIKERLKLPK